MSTCPRYLSRIDATIIKTDSTGQLLWIKGYDTGNYFKNYDVQGLMAWPDSTILITAYGQEADVYDSTNYFKTGLSLFQIDYDGTLRFDSSYRLALASSDVYPKLAMLPNERIVTSCDNKFGPVNGGNNLLAINIADKNIDWSLGFPESSGNATIFELYATA